MFGPFRAPQPNLALYIIDDFLEFADIEVGSW
jgi:hypothetical protein